MPAHKQRIMHRFLIELATFDLFICDWLTSYLVLNKELTFNCVIEDFRNILANDLDQSLSKVSFAALISIIAVYVL